MNCETNFVGLDIGGANIKLADLQGYCDSRSFRMWVECNELACVLRDMLTAQEHGARSHAGTKPANTKIAVTITGELADCFETRRQGIQTILEQVHAAQQQAETWVYAVGGQWLTPEAACDSPWQVAASNWHALGNWLASSPIGISSNLIVDVGSTTTDIIPIHDGHVTTNALTDRERMECGQLVYTGVRRTSAAYLLQSLTLHHRECPVMAEHFATIDDAYLVLGEVEEDEADCDTADGKPRTRRAAHARLARLIGEDIETLSLEDARSIALQLARKQTTLLVGAILQVAKQDVAQDTLEVLFTGHGRCLQNRVAACLASDTCKQGPGKRFRFRWLSTETCQDISRVGPAYAVARLLAAAQE